LCYYSLMTPEISTLSNGLRVLSVPNKSVETVNVMFLTSIGSREEEDRNLGIAHFLEHMAFKGTPTRPNPIEINREIERLGARTNAFTWQEYTGYFIQGNKAHLAKYLDILSDIYLNSTFPETEMEKEKGVIIEEIKLHKDEPMYRASDLFFAATFGGTVLGRSILGSEETIKKMTREDFVEFRGKHAPENTIIAVAGNTNTEDVIENVDEIGRWKVEDRRWKIEDRRWGVEKNRKTELLLETRKSEQSHFRLGIKTCNLFSNLVPVCDVLSAHIGSGLGSMMFETLREKMGAAYYCASSDIYYKDVGVLKLSAGVATNRLEESLKRVIEEIMEIGEIGIGEKQLERAKEYIKGGLFMGMETTEGANGYYAFDLLLKGRLEEPVSYAHKIDLVTNEDIIKFVRSIFKPENLSLAVVGDYSDNVKLTSLLRLWLRQESG